MALAVSKLGEPSFTLSAADVPNWHMAEAGPKALEARVEPADGLVLEVSPVICQAADWPNRRRLAGYPPWAGSTG